MITLSAVLLTWYATKVYYTRTLRVTIDDIKKRGLAEAMCSKCAKSAILKEEHLRTPFFCVSCK
jgi:hypothetical protein